MCRLRHCFFILVALFASFAVGCRRDEITTPGQHQTPRYRVGDMVPEEAPDLPFSSTQLVTDSSRIAAPFTPNIVVIRFVPGATQSERQAAVDAISGIVVGGVPFPDGIEGAYYVQIPADSTNDRVFAALDTLRSFPVVEDALLDLALTNEQPAYRRPNDGPGMRSTSWHLSPASAFGHLTRRTWALEAINAPFAWGCQTGEPSRGEMADG